MLATSPLPRIRNASRPGIAAGYRVSVTASHQLTGAVCLDVMCSAESTSATCGSSDGEMATRKRSRWYGVHDAAPSDSRLLPATTADASSVARVQIAADAGAVMF